MDKALEESHDRRHNNDWQDKGFRMRVLQDALFYIKYNVPPGERLRPDMVQSVSGQESDSGLVDYTFVGPDVMDHIETEDRPTALGASSVYHPIEKRWIRVGSFKQPSRQYIEKMYDVKSDFLCWDATYGCFVIDQTLRDADPSIPYSKALIPSWNRARSAYRFNSAPGLPIGEVFKEILCDHKDPRFIGYFTYKITPEEISTHNSWYENFNEDDEIRGRNAIVPSTSNPINGEKPSEDAVYNWWEEKWNKPGDIQTPGRIPEGWLRNNQWYVWDTALGLYRTPGDWKTKDWLDDYSSLIVDGIVSYGGEMHPAYTDWHYMVGMQGDRYVGAAADGEYSAFADKKRAELIKYMKGES